MTISNPAKTRSVKSSLRFWKIYQPKPPSPLEAPNTSSAEISVLQAKAQPLFRLERIGGYDAGIRIVIT